MAEIAFTFHTSAAHTVSGSRSGASGASSKRRDGREHIAFQKRAVALLEEIDEFLFGDPDGDLSIEDLYRQLVNALNDPYGALCDRLDALKGLLARVSDLLSEADDHWAVNERVALQEARTVLCREISEADAELTAL